MFLPNVSSPALTPLFLNIAMHENLTLPVSNHLLPHASNLFSIAPRSLSISILLFISIQLLTFFTPRILQRYILHRQQRAQDLSNLNDALAELRDRLAELEETISHDSKTYIPWPSPDPALIRSVSDSGGQFDEFGSPPSLDERDDFTLPSPALGPIEGHAALGSFYRTDVVYEQLQRREGGEELGPVARNPALSALLKRIVEERAGLWR